MTRAAESPHKEKGEFRQLLSYTIPGYASGILLAAALDHFGLQRSGIGQWLVRTLSGEGESLFEGAFAVRQRMRRASVSMAEAYGWGKLVGMAAPWLIDWASRALGVDVYGVGGFYIPYFYALSDQIGANVSGLLFLRREEGTWPNAAARSNASARLTSKKWKCEPTWTGRSPVLRTLSVVTFSVPWKLIGDG